ncbi:hypothetical protein Syun_015974 [Stephania yunnanensis]|uniref:Uncharacterized protein n=1 Tax=Stephania yunnanensis TaxID=152371 RepID=A0AAP0P0X7_9MAGN
MSWLRSAVNKAVEVGGKNNLTRAVRSYADTVVHHAGQAVAEGAKILQDRMIGRNFKSFKHTVRRLEEVSVSCRGEERTQLLRRWLVALKEIERLSAASSDGSEQVLEQTPGSDESKDTTARPSLILVIMPSPFVFIYCGIGVHSNAEKNNVLLKILEAPGEEEVSILLEIFGLCLTGGKEVHNAIVSSVQDLAKAFSTYQDEVLVLISALQAVSDFKFLTDAESLIVQKKLDEMREKHTLTSEEHEEKPNISTVEALKVALAEVRLCSRLEALLLQKKSLFAGDSPDIRSQKPKQNEMIPLLDHCSMLGQLAQYNGGLYAAFGKDESLHVTTYHSLFAVVLLYLTTRFFSDPQIDKLKVLSQSLASSMSKAEKRISDHRVLHVLGKMLSSDGYMASEKFNLHFIHQREDALKFRATKANEAGDIEKDLASEISSLEKQRDELEAELKRVNISLSAALARLRNAREEREQFDEASNQIVTHLKAKEDELSKSIASCKVEADVVNTWINFLEDTWALQSTYMEQKDQQAKYMQLPPIDLSFPSSSCINAVFRAELEKFVNYFIELVIRLLSSYKEELAPSIGRIRTFVENLKNIDGSDGAPGVGSENAQVLNPRKNVEEEYLQYEAKVQALNLIYRNDLQCSGQHKRAFLRPAGKYSWEDSPKVKELFDSIEKIREEFELIERPTLELEIPPPKANTSSQSKLQKSPSQPSTPKADASSQFKVQSPRHPSTPSKNDDFRGSPSAIADQSLDTAAELAN